MEGYINVDMEPIEGVNVIHDLNTIPFPFEDNSADEIIAHRVLEHIINPPQFIKECHRILKKGGTFNVILPVASFSINHLRGTYVKDIFKAWTVNYGFGQSGPYFDLVYQKRSLKRKSTLYYRFRNWLLNLITSEWEYKLRKN